MKVLPYDIMNCNRYIQGRYLTLEVLGDSLEKELTKRMCKVLNTNVQMNLICITQMSFEPNDSTVSVFNDGQDDFYVIKNREMLVSCIEQLTHYTCDFSCVITNTVKFIDDWFNLNVFLPAIRKSFTILHPDFTCGYTEYNPSIKNYQLYNNNIAMEFVLESNNFHTQKSTVTFLFPYHWIYKYELSSLHDNVKTETHKKFTKELVSKLQNIPVTLDVTMTIENISSLTVGDVLVLPNTWKGKVYDIPVLEGFCKNVLEGFCKNKKFIVNGIEQRNKEKLQIKPVSWKDKPLCPLKTELNELQFEIIPIQAAICDFLPYRYTIWLYEKFSIIMPPVSNRVGLEPASVILQIIEYIKTKIRNLIEKEKKND